MSKDILDAPCAFCGYNGDGYWQPGTHRHGCPWENRGGHDERQSALRSVLKKMMRIVAAQQKGGLKWA